MTFEPPVPLPVELCWFIHGESPCNAPAAAAETARAARPASCCCCRAGSCGCWTPMATSSGAATATAAAQAPAAGPTAWLRWGVTWRCWTATMAACGWRPSPALAGPPQGCCCRRGTSAAAGSARTATTSTACRARMCRCPTPAAPPAGSAIEVRCAPARLVPLLPRRCFNRWLHRQKLTRRVPCRQTAQPARPSGSASPGLPWTPARGSKSSGRAACAAVLSRWATCQGCAAAAACASGHALLPFAVGGAASVPYG
jgi:hypothetical protein